MKVRKIVAPLANNSVRSIQRGTADTETEPDKITYFITLFDKNQPPERAFQNILNILVFNGREYGIQNQNWFSFSKFDFQLPFDYALFSVDKSCQGAILSSAEAIQQHAGYLRKCKGGLHVLNKFLDKYAPWMLFLLADGGKTRLEKKNVQNWYDSVKKIFGSTERSIPPFIYTRKLNGVFYTTLLFRDKSAYKEYKELGKVFVEGIEVQIKGWEDLDDPSSPLYELKANITHHRFSEQTTGKIY